MYNRRYYLHTKLKYTRGCSLRERTFNMSEEYFNNLSKQEKEAILALQNEFNYAIQLEI